MAANTAPIYSLLGDVSNNDGTTFGAAITTATGDYTGASANHVLVHTGDATNGSYVRRLRFQAIGTNVATVARIYINNGSANTTPANNVFYGQQSLPATTAINTAATVEVDYPMELALPPGFRIYVGVGTTVAAGWVVTAVAGQY
jgi:hypothetical protein